MTKLKCDLTNPKFTFFYYPSYPAAVVFAVLFSITTTIHVYQAYRYRMLFATILIMGGVWEALGYIIRTSSVQNPYASGLNTAQMLLILLAPLWINAFIYMLVGRMIHFFLEDDRVFGIKARKMTITFVVFDIIAFLVQGSGGSMTVSDNISTALNGLHIYTAGVALQIAFNIFFLTITIKFHLVARSKPSVSNTGNGAFPLQDYRSRSYFEPSIHRYETYQILLRLVYIVLILIFVRNFYRLAEYASGAGNKIITTEWYAYVFDAVPMLIAMVIINVFHPGMKLQGPRCDFSEESAMLKQARKHKRAAKRGLTNVMMGTSKQPGVVVNEV